MPLDGWMKEEEVVVVEVEVEIFGECVLQRPTVFSPFLPQLD